MSDQSRLISRHQVTSHPQLMGQSQVLNQSQMLNESQLVNMPRMTSQPQMLNQLNKQQIMSQMNPSQMVSQAPMITQPPSMRNQSKMMSQNYGNWPNHPANLPPMNTMTFSNPMMQMYGAKKPRPSNWRKKAMDKRNDKRRKDMVAASGAGGGPGGAGYKPPTLHELEHQNRLRARRFYPRKKYNRMAPYAHAPRNTSSYIIRAKKSGGIASLVSPCPVTPAVLPTPVLSPSREALVEMAKEEWGVDGYGSMKGLIRLRSSPGHEEPGHEAEVYDYEEEEEGESSESDVEEHVEVERRLDHDLSRFEMIYPNSGVDYNNVLENQVDDQYTRIAQFEEENLLLKERLYLMERELGDLRRRLQFLERQSQVVEDINEDVIKNASENESEGLRDAHLGQSGNDEADHVSREEEAGQHEKKENGSVDAANTYLYRDAVEKEGTDLNVEEGRKDEGLVNDGLTLVVKIDDKKELHENQQTGDTCIGDNVQECNVEKEKGNVGLQLESEGILVVAAEGGINETLKNEQAGDVCMEDNVSGGVNEDSRCED